MKITQIQIHNPLSLHDLSTHPGKRIRAENAEGKNQLLKIGIWLYFLLLIFEGALRKWILPGLSTPLLIIRDPVALWMILMALRKGLLPSNIYLNCMLFIGLIGIFIAIFLDHGDLAVALYGARILIIHFPLIFIIGNVFTRDDVERLGRVLIFISIPMVLLIAIQFYSPQSAWVNRGVGGDLAGAGFSGALGYYRPPGTFSFTNGNALFFAFVASYVIYFWLNPKRINRVILAIATIGLIAAIPLSISRSLFFSVLISLGFAMIVTLRKPQFIGHIVLIAGIGFISLTVLNGTKFFTTSTKAFISRFESANKAEGGITGVMGTRYIGGMSGSLMKSSKIPLLGYGLGMGTNAGAVLLTGNKSFLVSEEEWGRVIGELGPILGISVILIRLSLVAKMAVFAIRKLNDGDLLPWMLLSFAVMVIPEGLWAQPTLLGFSTLIGGLIIASLRRQGIQRKPLSL